MTRVKPQSIPQIKPIDVSCFAVSMARGIVIIVVAGRHTWRVMMQSD
jgi:hypothetical protein